MIFRKYLCRMLDHRYRVIWFKPSDLHVEIQGQAGVADTEAGCIYCGLSKPNTYLMNVADIDWTMTKHRKKPPINNTVSRRRG